LAFVEGYLGGETVSSSGGASAEGYAAGGTGFEVLRWEGGGEGCEGEKGGGDEGLHFEEW
jgi:hypothetical protein